MPIDGVKDKPLVSPPPLASKGGGKDKAGEEDPSHNSELAKQAQERIGNSLAVKETPEKGGDEGTRVTISPEARKAAEGKKVTPPEPTVYDRPKPKGIKPKP